MRGKYSPTVSAAYQADQEWWRRYTGENEFTYHQYDPEGFDSYGYDQHDMDRAGNYEHEYYSDDEGGVNWKYSHALDHWTFDGEKPVLVNSVANPLNKRVQQIAKASGLNILYDYSSDGHACVINLTDLDKFARLLVNECANIALHYTDVDEAVKVFKQHLGA